MLTPFLSCLWVQVWQSLASASGDLGAVPSYRFDLIDVAREVISANFSATYVYVSSLFSISCRFVFYGLYFIFYVLRPLLRSAVQFSAVPSLLPS